MSHDTITTTDLNQKLGFVLTADFIARKLRVAPAEIVKGKPRWSHENCRSICYQLRQHLTQDGLDFRIADELPDQPAAVKPTQEDDDDEL